MSIQLHISCTAATLLSNSLATIGAAVQTFAQPHVIKNLERTNLETFKKNWAFLTGCTSWSEVCATFMRCTIYSVSLLLSVASASDIS